MGLRPFMNKCISYHIQNPIILIIYIITTAKTCNARVYDMSIKQAM